MHLPAEETERCIEAIGPVCFSSRLYATARDFDIMSWVVLCLDFTLSLAAQDGLLPLSCEYMIFIHSKWRMIVSIPMCEALWHPSRICALVPWPDLASMKPWSASTKTSTSSSSWIKSSRISSPPLRSDLIESYEVLRPVRKLLIRSINTAAVLDIHLQTIHEFLRSTTPDIHAHSWPSSNVGRTLSSPRLLQSNLLMWRMERLRNVGLRLRLDRLSKSRRNTRIRRYSTEENVPWSIENWC